MLSVESLMKQTVQNSLLQRSAITEQSQRHLCSFLSSVIAKSKMMSMQARCQAWGKQCSRHWKHNTKQRSSISMNWEHPTRNSSPLHCRGQIWISFSLPYHSFPNVCTFTQGSPPTQLERTALHRDRWKQLRECKALGQKGKASYRQWRVQVIFIRAVTVGYSWWLLTESFTVSNDKRKQKEKNSFAAICGTQRMFIAE